MIPVTITHIDEALTKVTDSFKGRAVMEGILKALCASLQKVEVSTFDLYQKRLIDSATDDALDKQGALVGEARLGRSDADYRAAIRLRVRINGSFGRTSDLVAITRLIDVNATYREGDEASFEIKTLDATGIGGLRSSLPDARPAGVYGILTYSTWPVTVNLVRGSSTGAGYSNYLRGSTVGSVGTPGLRISSEAIR